jgi:hypothetical protein
MEETTTKPTEKRTIIYRCDVCGFEGPAFTDDKERPKGSSLIDSLSRNLPGTFGAQIREYLYTLTEPPKRCSKCKSGKIKKIGEEKNP